MGLKNEPENQRTAGRTDDALYLSLFLAARRGRGDAASIHAGDPRRGLPRGVPGEPPAPRFLRPALVARPGRHPGGSQSAGHEAVDPGRQPLSDGLLQRRVAAGHGSRGLRAVAPKRDLSRAGGVRGRRDASFEARGFPEPGRARAHPRGRILHEVLPAL